MSLLSGLTTNIKAMSHSITTDEAAIMTRRYRKYREIILSPAEKGRDILPISETFDKKSIERLLSDQHCTALRIYYGMDEERKVHAILVGSNANDEDILPQDGGENQLIERGVRCPPQCPEPSELNEP
jgi:hypothetical protein